MSRSAARCRRPASHARNSPYSSRMPTSSQKSHCSAISAQMPSSALKHTRNTLISLTCISLTSAFPACAIMRAGHARYRGPGSAALDDSASRAALPLSALHDKNRDSTHHHDGNAKPYPIMAQHLHNRCNHARHNATHEEESAQDRVFILQPVKQKIQIVEETIDAYHLLILLNNRSTCYESRDRKNRGETTPAQPPAALPALSP